MFLYSLLQFFIGKTELWRYIADYGMSVSKDPWGSVRIVGSVHTLEMLESLYDGPKRFADLKEVCPNESTRTGRLRMLEEEGYVETETIRVKRRSFVHYKLTEKGRKAAEHFLAIKELFG